MNEKFFALPHERQQSILDAAYQVFSQSSYKGASMSEIATCGGISKALLFHYFTNKKELYMYLWNHALEVTKQAVSEYKVMETDDFFEMLHRSLLAKCSLMEKYPYISAFSLNAYYEQYPEIKSAIEDSFSQESQISENLVLSKINTAKLRKDIDKKAMYEEIFYAMDGYMLKKYRSGRVDPEEIEKEISVLINLWRTIYTGEDEVIYYDEYGSRDNPV